MKARLLAYWDELMSSYWFVPTMMTLTAIVLSFATTRVDGIVGPEWIEGISWLYPNKPDGARTLLSTVAGSMIGVAGVTFSITIASVVYASGQYGPRLLTNFMSDRGNQITLGTFIATFMYCLLVLRTIRSPDEPAHHSGPDDALMSAFVPHIAILTAIGLTLASIAVLIYFIHHVPASIHVSNVIAGVGEDLRSKIDSLFPERIGQDAPSGEERARSDARTDLPEHFLAEAEAIPSTKSGYVLGIDADALLRIASDRDFVVRVRHGPGDFVTEGDSLLLVWPADRLDDDCRNSLRLVFAWGKHRTGRQDTRFLINELVEIAARALSPGVNDPFTAMGCMDWLGRALKCLAGREIPSAKRYDDEGSLRIIANPTSFEGYVDHIFGQLRPYVAADRNAALHALKTIGEVTGRLTTDDRRKTLRKEADVLLQASEALLAIEADKEAIRRAHRVVIQLLISGDRYEAIVTESREVGGTA